MPKRKNNKKSTSKTTNTSTNGIPKIVIKGSLMLDKVLEQHEKTFRIIANVERTHQGLGRMALFEVLSDIASKCLLVVGSSGTGKSAIMHGLSRAVPRDVYRIDAVTVNGLRHLQKDLTDANLTILVDDLSKGGSTYAQATTVVALAELVYTGHFVKSVSQFKIEIYNFTGSAIINVQPGLLKKLMASEVWETDIRDKTVRWYNLRYPINFSRVIPFYGVNYTYKDLKKIEFPKELQQTWLWQKVVENFMHQHSIMRANEHSIDYAKALAILNDRDQVSWTDLLVLEWITRNLRLEPVLFEKTELEGTRRFDLNIIPLLGLCATFGEFHIAELCTRFQVRLARAYQIIRAYNDLVILREHDSIVIPSDQTRELLRDIGEIA